AVIMLFFFQPEAGIRYLIVTGVQTCALPTSRHLEACAQHADAAIHAGNFVEDLQQPPMHDLRGVERLRHAQDPAGGYADAIQQRSEEHTSELQSRSDLVCRLLLEKKNKRT